MENSNSKLTRRSFMALAGGAAAMAGLALAGCGNTGDTGTTEPADDGAATDSIFCGESAASGWSSSLVTAATAPTGSDCGNSSRPRFGRSVTPEIEARTDFGPASAATGSCIGAA